MMELTLDTSALGLVEGCVLITLHSCEGRMLDLCTMGSSVSTPQHYA